MEAEDYPALVSIESDVLTPVRGRIFIIGSSPECHLQITGRKAPAIAAHLLFRGGSYTLQAVSDRTPITVNGKVVTSPQELSHDDRLGIGGERFIFAERSLDMPPRFSPPHSAETAGVSGRALNELINTLVALLRNTSDEMFADLVASVSRIMSCDAVRLVEEGGEHGERKTVARYPVASGLERFSGRAIDWACSAGRTVIMHDDEWRSAGDSAASLEKNLVGTVLCAPLQESGAVIGYLYLDRLQGNRVFTEEDRQFCDALLPLFSEILAIRRARLRQREVIARLQEGSASSSGGIIFDSESMRRCMELAAKAAVTDLPVLILGETGTGKELFARLVCAESPRAGRPFKAINCGALPENLIESELFGYEKGAFTGANSRKQGLFEAADTGTVFLDEIGEMPVHLQVKLLRVLQEGEFSRVGGTETIRVDVRIVAATNKRLSEQVASGAFRQDLFFRLNVMAIELPPLRMRGGDILLLSEFFIKKYCAQFGMPAKTMTAGARNLLSGYSWPGNIRELENVIQKAIIMSSGSRIAAEELSLQKGTCGAEAGSGQTLREARERAEHACIVNALARTRGNVSLAARQIEIDRKWLIKKMEELGIEPDGFRRGS